MALASVLIAAILLLLFLPRNAGPFRAVPTQASLVLECKGLLKAKLLTEKTQDPLWQEVLQSTLFDRCFEDALAGFQLFKHVPHIMRAFAQNKALAAFSLNPADDQHGMFALVLDEGIDLEKVLKINQLTPKYFQHQFHGNNIYSVHISKTEQLVVAVSGKLLLFSRKATLVEDALAQLENAHNWWTDRPYIPDLAEAPLCMHLRPAALSEQWRNQMLPRWRELPDMLARNLEWLGISWDKQVQQILIESNGALSFQNAWGSEERNERIFNLLPDNTAFLVRARLGNIPDFFRQIGDGRSSDFEQYVLPWVGPEAAFLITEPLSPALSGDRLLLLAVRDSAEAVQKLQAYGKANGLLPEASGAYQMFELTGFQNAGLLKPLLGEDAAFRNPVCALVEQYVVFAPDRSSLEIFLDKYLVNQTLATNTDFLQLPQSQTRKGSVSLLMNTAYLPGMLQNLFAEPESFPSLKPAFAAFELQAGTGRKTVVSQSIQALTQAPSQTDILWKSVFESPIATQPIVVEQPDGKTFVLAQDLKNTLHCLDAQNGETVWTRPLPAHLLSGIQGIDFYGNGIKCYTFNTARHLYILDENGRDVNGFPFELSAPASNGASVVDFDKSTRFSHFVACENGKIYGFGHQGKPLDGWNGLPSNGVVRQPILQFQHKGKDYLAVLTDAGLLSVFGRDGRLHFDPIQLDKSNAAFKSPMEVDLAAPSPRIYCANTAGAVFTCDLQGRVTAFPVGKAGSVIAFGQLTGDARYEWAAFSGKTIAAGLSAKPLVSISNAQFSDKKSLLFFPANHQIGLVDIQSRRIWLYHGNGKKAAGFPLGGNTAFQFVQINGVKILVVGNGNGVWAYRMR